MKMRLGTCAPYPNISGNDRSPKPQKKNKLITNATVYMMCLAPASLVWRNTNYNNKSIHTEDIYTFLFAVGTMVAMSTTVEGITEGWIQGGSREGIKATVHEHTCVQRPAGLPTTPDKHRAELQTFRRGAVHRCTVHFGKRVPKGKILTPRLD